MNYMKKHNYKLKVNYKKSHNITYPVSFDLVIDDIVIRNITGREAEYIENMINLNDVTKVMLVNKEKYITDEEFIKNYVRIPSNYVSHENKFGKIVAIAAPITALFIASLIGIKNDVDAKNDAAIVAEADEEVEDKKTEITKLEETPNVDFVYEEVDYEDKDIFKFAKDDISNLDYAKRFLNLESDDNKLPFDQASDLERNKLAKYIFESSSEYGIDARLIGAIMATENKFGSHNYSNVGGHGWGQLESGTECDVMYPMPYNNSGEHESISVDTVRAENDDEYSIKMIAAMFNSQYNYYYDTYNLSDRDNFIVTLFSYNKGIGTAEKAIKASYDSNNNFNINTYIDNMKGIPGGNPEYLNDVLSGIEDGSVLSMRTHDGKVHKIVIDNLSIDNDYENDSVDWIDYNPEDSGMKL